MPKEQFVVKLNDTTDLFLTYYSTDPAHCLWGAVNDALTWPTLLQAQNIAASIGSGPVGVPR